MNGSGVVRRHAAAFGRFAGLGSVVTLAASAALVLLSRWIPWSAANALATVASTVVATELHARVSFGHGRPGWTGHLNSAATMAFGWLVTSAAVGSLAALRPGAGLVLQETVYLSATALVGIGRYLVLRLVVFAERAPRPRTAGGVRLRPPTTRQREGRRGVLRPRLVPDSGDCCRTARIVRPCIRASGEGTCSPERGLVGGAVHGRRGRRSARPTRPGVSSSRWRMRLGRRAGPHRRPGADAGRRGRPHCRLPTRHPCVPGEFPQAHPVFTFVS